MNPWSLLSRGVLAVGLTAACGCADKVPVQPPAAVPRVVLEQSQVDLDRPAVLLPAFETAAEKAALGKVDLAGETRNSFKQWYAQTKPLEPGRFRAFQEWEPMKDVWTTYTTSIISQAPVRRMMAQMVIHFVRDSNPKVKAHVIVPGPTVEADFLQALEQYGITADEKALVEMVTLPNQTIWHIDYGPLPIVDKQAQTLSFSDFMYYGPRQIDDAIPTRLASEYYKDVSVYRMPMSFEGGNFQADGTGRCMTSLRELQNTGYSVAKTKKILKDYAACDDVIIVKDISDDGTGHIDMFFKWIDVDHVMFGQYDDEITLDYDGDGKEETLPVPGSLDDYKATFQKNQKRMNDNVALFQGMTAPNGKPYTISRLSMMTRYNDQYGDLPRTFINSTFVNGINVYPAYATKSCRDPAGTVCMKDSDCASGAHCASAHCTPGTVTDGCDELMKCGQGQECVDDPLKIALSAKVQKQWEEAMPTWKHVGLGADTIALWSGAVHCITRTIPNLPGKKTVADGLCIAGHCDCSPGGTTQACTADSECWGPKWLCGCNKCVGTCATGVCIAASGKPATACDADVDCASDVTPTTKDACRKSCTDDIDCAADGKTITPGACTIDPQQGCYGLAPDDNTPVDTGDATSCPGAPDAGSSQDGAGGDAQASGDCGDKACDGLGSNGDAKSPAQPSKTSIGHDSGCSAVRGAAGPTWGWLLGLGLLARLWWRRRA